MKCARIAVCLIAIALLTGATGVAPAAAVNPEFVYTAAGKAFTGASGTPNLIETTSGIKVSCKTNKVSGEIEGTSPQKKVKKVLYTFTGCEASGFSCNTHGFAAGEIMTGELVGELGYINTAAKKVGLDLKAVSPASITTFECAPFVRTAVVEGSVIAEIAPVNSLVKGPLDSFSLAYSQASGVQKPTHFEGAANDVLSVSLNGSPFVEAGLEVTDKLTPGGEVKINA
jgi:hypothetical protein